MTASPVTRVSPLPVTTWPVLTPIRTSISTRIAKLYRRPHGAKGVVLVNLGDAENRHHRIPDELLHRPTVPLDRGACTSKYRAIRCASRLRIEPLASAVEPMTSQKSTDTVLRCSGGSSAAKRPAPHESQKRAPSPVLGFAIRASGHADQS